jgi:hypothetical protein
MQDCKGLSIRLAFAWIHSHKTGVASSRPQHCSHAYCVWVFLHLANTAESGFALKWEEASRTRSKSDHASLFLSGSEAFHCVHMSLGREDSLVRLFA